MKQPERIGKRGSEMHLNEIELIFEHSFLEHLGNPVCIISRAYNHFQARITTGLGDTSKWPGGWGCDYDTGCKIERESL